MTITHICIKLYDFMRNIWHSKNSVGIPFFLHSSLALSNHGVQRVKSFIIEVINGRDLEQKYHSKSN